MLLPNTQPGAADYERFAEYLCTTPTVHLIRDGTPGSCSAATLSLRKAGQFVASFRSRPRVCIAQSRGGPLLCQFALAETAQGFCVGEFLVERMLDLDRAIALLRETLRFWKIDSVALTLPECAGTQLTLLSVI